MADRPPAPPPRTAAEARVPSRGRSGTRVDAEAAPRRATHKRSGRHGAVSQPAHPVSPAVVPMPPADATAASAAAFAADAPLMDLIFPNRAPSSARGFEPSTAYLDRAAGFTTQVPGPTQLARSRERRRGLFRRRAKVTRALPGITDRPVRRRRLLLGLGTGVVVAGAAGTGATMLSGVLGGSGGASSRGPSTADGLGAAGLADSPSAAARIAAAATPTFPTPLTRDPELHLLRRATFGPTATDLVAVRQMGVDAWLERQLSPAQIADPKEDQIRAIYPTVAMTTADLRKNVKDGDYLPMFELGQATLARQMWSSRQLYEVMVDFWANHLNVVNPMDGGWDIRGPYDTDVIRRYAMGRFADMLHASARHPAMLRYLNNDQSERRSVNENYGRELLELHTVGLEARYTEKDVRQSAYIMTGRTIDDQSRFSYRSGRHWTGKVTVLGFTHANATSTQGLAVGDAYVSYLAMHPATATRIATKLARRFVCDDPPKTLVERLAQSYLDSGSAIVPVLRTLFNSVEFWMSTGLKTRRPLENVVATARVLGVGRGNKTGQGLEGMYYMTNQLGMAPLNWGPPDGYADYADAWGSAHATLGTWNSHRALVQGYHEGLSYPAPESFVGMQPATVGQYLDTISQRLVFQAMMPAHKAALLKFLNAKETTKVKSLTLSGKVDNLIPLVLDSVYHALR